MKIVAVVGSMRRQGNTELLTDIVLKSAQNEGAETEEIMLADSVIRGCIGCDSCKKTGVCQTKDETRDILVKLKSADGILLASPVYFWAISAQLKAILDRSYSFLHDKQLRGKIAGIVLVARRGGVSASFSQLNNYINKHRMYMAGGVVAYGREKGEVLQDFEGKEDADKLGKSICSLYRKIYG